MWTKEMDLSWSNLTVSTEKSCTQKSRPILQNVSGVAKSGELLAIMGTSGAGKTTLLNTLLYQNMYGLEVTHGTRYLNGIKTNANMMTCLAGYVPQSDILIGTLKVREHLEFLATLKLGNFSKVERQKRIDELLIQFGLKKCENTVIGVRGQVKGISGGEMRRLSFVSEILAKPSLLLCDEVTTGLDSWMAENVVGQMRQLAKAENKTVVCVIHQPSAEVFRLFDRVLLMSQGKVAFMGKVSEAETFFNDLGFPCPLTFNHADHYIFKLSMVPRHEEEYEQRCQYICQSYATSKYSKYTYIQ